MKQIATLAAAVVLLVACGGPKPSAAPKPDSTATLGESLACAQRKGTDTTGAVCETVLPVDTTARPAPKPKPAGTQAAQIPRLWDFGSTTCIPCKTMKGILEPMMVDYKGKVDVRIIDVYKEKELAREYKIVTIPTQVFIDASGKELYRHIGVYPRDSMEACFAKFGFPIVAGNPAPTQQAPTGGT